MGQGRAAYLVGHVASRGAVEVVVGPAGEAVLLEIGRGLRAMVVERKFGLRLQEPRLLHLSLSLSVS